MLSLELVCDVPRLCFVDGRTEPERSRAIVERNGTATHPPKLHRTSPVIGIPCGRGYSQVTHVRQIVFFGSAKARDIPLEGQHIPPKKNDLCAPCHPEPRVKSRAATHRPHEQP